MIAVVLAVLALAVAVLLGRLCRDEEVTEAEHRHPAAHGYRSWGSE